MDPISLLGVSLATSFLLSRLEGLAESKDQKKRIEKALDAALGRAFQWFEDEFPDLTRSLFDKHFVNTHLNEELYKLYSPNLQPDSRKTAEKLLEQIPVANLDELVGATAALFERIKIEMLDEPVLQQLLARRESFETNQEVRALKGSTDAISAKLDQFIEQYALQPIGNGAVRNPISAAGGSVSSIPEDDQDPANRIIKKHIERVRSFLPLGRIREARELLLDIEDEARELGGFVLFRYLTCLAACDLNSGKLDSAAERYLQAFEYAPKDEKALANRARAFLIFNRLDKASETAENALQLYPESALLWAIKLNISCLTESPLGEEDIPAELLSSPDILLTLAHCYIQKGDFSTAFAYAKKGSDPASDGIETINILVYSALSWALKDPLPPGVFKPTGDNFEALKYAAYAFDQNVEKLERADLTPTLHTIINNAALCFDLLGDRSRASEIAQKGIQRGFCEDGIFRIMLESLVREGRIGEAHQFCRQYGSSCSNEMLLSALELAANNNSEDWLADISEMLGKRQLSKEASLDYKILTAIALQRRGDLESAVSMAEELVQEDPENLVLQIVVARMKWQQGDEIAAYLGKIKELTPLASRGLKYQVADLLSDIGKDDEAIDIFESVIDEPTTGYASERYLHSLLTIGARHKVQGFLDRLSPEQRNEPPFRRIEMMLASSMSDTKRLTELCITAVAEYPENGYFANLLAECFLLENDKEQLSSLLASDPKFIGTFTEDLEFAKKQLHFGFPLQAIKRLYRQFRNNSTDPEVAGWYMQMILGSPAPAHEFSAETAGPGAVTDVRTSSGTYKFGLEFDGLAGISPWHEVRIASDPAVSDLKNRTVGESVSVLGEDALIVQNTHLLLFAYEKAQEVINNNPGWSGPIMQFNAVGKDGKHDFSQILELDAKSNEFRRQAFTLYAESTLPISLLAQLIKTDPISLVLNWPANISPRNVSRGSLDELNRHVERLRGADCQFAADLPTLIEITCWQIWQPLLNFTGPLLVPQSEVTRLKHVLENMRISRIHPINAENERSSSFTRNPMTIAETMLDWIEKKCEVVPVMGPESPIANQAFLKSALDAGSFDTILLTHQFSACLITDDDPFRFFSEESGARDVVRFQAILRHLRDEKKITQAQYSRIVLGKVACGDTFINLSFKDLSWGALQDPDSLPDEMTAVIWSFSRPGLDVRSTIGVYGKFIRTVVEHLEPSVVRKYHSLFLEALVFGRADLAYVIEVQLFIQIEAAIEDANLNRVSRRRLATMLRRFRSNAIERAQKEQENTIDLRQAIRQVNRSLRTTDE